MSQEIELNDYDSLTKVWKMILVLEARNLTSETMETIAEKI